MLPVLPRNIKLTLLSVPNESEKRITRINFSVASIRMAVILIFETLLKESDPPTLHCALT